MFVKEGYDLWMPNDAEEVSEEAGSRNIFVKGPTISVQAREMVWLAL